MKKFFAFIILAALTAGLVGCQGATLLDPGDPVTLTMWHVYGEQADSPMNELIDEFNSTVGRDKGVIINVTLISNASQIGQQLSDAQSGMLGAPDMPDLFFCHKNNAKALGADNLIDWNEWFSPEELDLYVEDFIKDGIVNERLVILPVSKSTHLLFINDAQFERFSADTGITYADLATWDGFFEVCAAFYDWSGGTPFCAFDYMMRAVELYLESDGHTDYMTDEGWYDLKNAAFKQAWTKFALALSKGHIVVSDLYSNTQVMTGEAAAGLGSSAAILYYNDTVTYSDNTSEPMQLRFLPMPIAARGNALSTQAGVGLSAYKTTEQKAEAASVFAHWLTESERNLEFVTDTGYMPAIDGSFDGIDGYAFENESYKALYVTLKQVREARTLVPEYTAVGYYDRLGKLYSALRTRQYELEERCLAGEAPEALAEELWTLFTGIS